MQIQRVRPATLQVTLQAAELSTLIAAARLVAEGTRGDLPDEARDQLRQVLASYDRQVARLGP